MKCSQSKLLISWAMDETLPEYEGARLETHLQACNPCATYRTQLQRGRELFARAMATPSDNFEWKVQLKIQQALREAAARALPARERSRFWLPAGVTAATTALAVVAIGGLVLLDPDLAQPPSGGAPAVSVTEPGPLPSVQNAFPSAAPSHDARVAGGNQARGMTSATSAVDAPGTTQDAARQPLAASQGVRSRRAADPRSTGRTALQEVGMGTGLIQHDGWTTPSPGTVLLARPTPPTLAERDLLEQQLLATQHRADELRRLLDDFEFGGVIAASDTTAPDSLLADAPPRR